MYRSSRPSSRSTPEEEADASQAERRRCEDLQRQESLFNHVSRVVSKFDATSDVDGPDIPALMERYTQRSSVLVFVFVVIAWCVGYFNLHVLWSVFLALMLSTSLSVITSRRARSKVRKIRYHLFAVLDENSVWGGESAAWLNSLIPRVIEPNSEVIMGVVLSACNYCFDNHLEFIFPDLAKTGMLQSLQLASGEFGGKYPYVNEIHSAGVTHKNPNRYNAGKRTMGLNLDFEFESELALYAECRLTKANVPLSICIKDISLTGVLSVLTTHSDKPPYLCHILASFVQLDDVNAKVAPGDMDANSIFFSPVRGSIVTMIRDHLKEWVTFPRIVTVDIAKLVGGDANNPVVPVDGVPEGALFVMTAGDHLKITDANKWFTDSLVNEFQLEVANFNVVPTLMFARSAGTHLGTALGTVMKTQLDNVDNSRDAANATLQRPTKAIGKAIDKVTRFGGSGNVLGQKRRGPIGHAALEVEKLNDNKFSEDGKEAAGRFGQALYAGVEGIKGFAGGISDAMASGTKKAAAIIPEGIDSSRDSSATESSVYSFEPVPMSSEESQAIVESIGLG
eukprot:TRINITY_DN2784_c0_g1_i1.p1 TRINITY_DN2784_c0_g1~~TRINITY_DN2784_c0_g1_i1.p1  ORF type:complete len:600 (+),score=148.00 TRINITY_DN2784_c0_g1_i1:104-1801(+)